MIYDVICENCQNKCGKALMDIEHSENNGVEVWKCRNFVAQKTTSRKTVQWMMWHNKYDKPKNYLGGDQ